MHFIDFVKVWYTKVIKLIIEMKDNIVTSKVSMFLNLCCYKIDKLFFLK